MSVLRSLFLFLLPALLMGTAPDRGTGALTYRVKLRLRGETTPIITRFTLVPTPIAATANRVKKSRMGAWRLEAQQPKDATFSQAMVLARVERLLYLSGPTPETELRNLIVHFGEKACKVWAPKVPAGLPVYAYLVEVAPGLLALNYLSGSFPGDEIAALEIQLESFRVEPGIAPAETGTVLLQTLRRLALTEKTSPSEAEQVVE